MQVLFEGLIGSEKREGSTRSKAIFIDEGITRLDVGLDLFSSWEKVAKGAFF